MSILLSIIVGFYSIYSLSHCIRLSKAIFKNRKKMTPNLYDRWRPEVAAWFGMSVISFSVVLILLGVL